MTDAERKLWREIRNRKAGGIKFRRQQCFGPYILDFYTAEKQVCIEVDGGGHKQFDNIERDQERDAFLRQQGIKTVRFWNQEVLNDLDLVLWRIKKELGLDPGDRP